MSVWLQGREDELKYLRRELREARAALDAMKIELDADYADMRKFQAKFIAADQERDHLRDLLRKMHRCAHGVEETVALHNEVQAALARETGEPKP